MKLVPACWLVLLRMVSLFEASVGFVSGFFSKLIRDLVLLKVALSPHGCQQEGSMNDMTMRKPLCRVVCGKQIIKPVNQLYPPTEDDQGRGDFDIVFFHGLQTEEDGDHAWKNAWLQRNTNVCWPQVWLPQDLGQDVRVISVSYDAYTSKTKNGLGNTESVTDIAANLRESLINRERWKLGERPFVLVGHCLGGLVIKALVVDLFRTQFRCGLNELDRIAITNAQAFFKNLRGVVFYAVPHSGSAFQDWGSKLLRHRKPSDVMKELEPFQRRMEQLNMDFESAVGKRSLNLFAFGEGLPTGVAGPTQSLVVKFASAQRLSGNNNYRVEDANHAQVCKPPTQEHSSYALLLKFLELCRSPNMAKGDASGM